MTPEQHTPETGLFWLSFCDPKRAPGTQFLGGCFVEVRRKESQEDTYKAAVKKTHILGINPGGEVIVSEFSGCKVHSSWHDMLLDKSTIQYNAERWMWGQPRL